MLYLGRAPISRGLAARLPSCGVWSPSEHTRGAGPGTRHLHSLPKPVASSTVLHAALASPMPGASSGSARISPRGIRCDCTRGSRSSHPEENRPPLVQALLHQTPWFGARKTRQHPLLPPCAAPEPHPPRPSCRLAWSDCKKASHKTRTHLWHLGLLGSVKEDPEQLWLMPLEAISWVTLRGCGGPGQSPVHLWLAALAQRLQAGWGPRVRTGGGFCAAISLLG